MINKTFDIMTNGRNSGSSKNILKKVWNFIWHSNSIWSWLVNIILAYIFIKFIFYPGLGLLFNTSYPLVAVVSGSMEHMVISYDTDTSPHLCGDMYDKREYFVSTNEFWDRCGSWYERNNISKEDFSKFLFSKGFNKGDIIFIYGSNPKNLKIGDVIVFQRRNGPSLPDPIIHRIVSLKDVDGRYYFTTKGDHNSGSGSIDLDIPGNIVLGKGVFRIPYLGWVKIWFVNLIEWIQSVRGI